MRVEANRCFLRKRNVLVTAAVVTCGSFQAKPLFADEAVTVKSETTSAVASSEGASSSSPKYLVSVYGGLMNLKTTKNRDVDKKGNLLGLTAGAQWNTDSCFAGAGLGFLSSSLKGNTDMTVGDQAATVQTPYVDVTAGYKIIPMISASLGLQLWILKGSDFAPENDHTGNRLYSYLNIGIHPDQTAPFAFHVRYLRDLTVADRVITGFLAGVDYQLPF